MEDSPYDKLPFNPLPPVSKYCFQPILSVQETAQYFRQERRRLKQARREERKQNGLIDSYQLSSSSDQSSKQYSSHSQSESQQHPFERARYPNLTPAQRKKLRRAQFNRPSNKPSEEEAEKETLEAMEVEERDEVEQANLEQGKEESWECVNEWNQDLMKLNLVDYYLKTAPYTCSMIYAPKIGNLLTSREYRNSHSYSQIKKQIDSLRVPNAPTRQQQLNTHQARGDMDTEVWDAKMWRLQQLIKMQAQIEQSYYDKYGLDQFLSS